MEVKKTPKADLNNKKLLFVEIGLVLALLVTIFAFEHKTTEKKEAALSADDTALIEEEIIPIIQDTPPPPPEAPKMPILSDQIDIVDDNIKVDDNILNLEDDANLGVEIMDYVEDVQEEVVEEEAIPFALVEEKPKFQGGDAKTFSAWVSQHLEYPEIAKENGVTGSRIMGGGFGGCTINLVKDELYDSFIADAKKKYAAKYGKEPMVIDVVIGDGSRRIC